MKTGTIQEIKRLFNKNEMNEDILVQLRADQRKGVQKIISQYEKRQKQLQRKVLEFHEKQAFDLQFQQKNQLLAGVDEAGRGPLAGPVVAAAVILPKQFELIGLTDSKQVRTDERKEFFDYIIAHAISYHISVIDQGKIDALNIYEATKLAMTEALANLQTRPQVALIDAVPLTGLPFSAQSITKGDEKSLAIAAASILAKVARDKLMEEIHQQFPMYQFSKNKGYGTKDHLQALSEYGPCKYHRRTFTPVKDMIKG